MPELAELRDIDTDSIYEMNLVNWLRADDRFMVKNLAAELGVSEPEVVHRAILLLATTPGKHDAGT